MKCMIVRTDFDDDSEFVKRIRQVMGINSDVTKQEKRLKYMSLIDRYRPATKGDETLSDNTSDNAGDKKLGTIFMYLNKLHRSPQQKVFHKFMIASFLRIIYGEDFEKQKHRVMKKYQFETRKQQVLICAPRRMGKTFATAFITIVMCVVMSDIEVSIFSPGKRQSVALMGVIVKFMENLGVGDRKVSRNEEKLTVRSLDGGQSKINAYPSAVKTLKGVSGTICILEEMAQIDPAVLYEVIVPLHQLDITSIIGISTITTENNFMTGYLKLKNSHGEPVFASKHIHLACEQCREDDIAHKCNHNKHLLPAWSSERKRKVINSMMKGQDAMLAREIGGVASSLHQRAFPQKFIRQFNDLPPYKLSYTSTYDFVFHSIDPHGAGSSSEIAVTTVVKTNGVFVLLGLESFPCKTAKENHKLIIDHINGIRRDTRFKNSKSIFILENNMGMESDHIADALERSMSNYVVMTERDDGLHTGFRTTNQMKTLAVETLRERFINDGIRIVGEDTFVSVSRGYKMANEMLIDQLSEFREMIKGNEISAPKKFYSGKSVGKDDIVMSLLLNVHWSGFLYHSPKYSSLCV